MDLGKVTVFSGSHLSRSEISKEQLPFFSMLGWLKVSVQSVLRKSRPGFPALGHDSEFKRQKAKPFAILRVGYI